MRQLLCYIDFAVAKEGMKVDNLSTVLRRRRKELGLTLLQVAEAVGVTEATVQRWESGNIKSVRHKNIGKLADVLKVSPATLMGWDNVSVILPGNVMPLHISKQVPLIGEIACGTPILAEENITDYVDLPGHIRADYALTCKGDSMVNAGIRDGDVVYIRQQSVVDNGQIAAVLVGDEEATLKRFYRVGDTVTLNAENPAFPPLVFVGEEVSRVHIIGLAIAYTHVIE